MVILLYYAASSHCSSSFPAAHFVQQVFFIPSFQCFTDNLLIYNISTTSCHYIPCYVPFEYCTIDEFVAVFQSLEYPSYSVLHTLAFNSFLLLSHRFTLQSIFNHSSS